ncbi:MAG: ATP-dependent DNA helicase [archaeon]
MAAQAFPFARIREGQREMAAEVAACIAGGKNLVAHAPTGIGKTAAALVPAAEWADSSGGTVFFLTPKHSQHRIAIETLKLLKAQGLKISAADFIGKKWLCQVSGAQELAGRDFLDYCASVRRDEICPFYNRTFRKSQVTGEAKKAAELLLEKQPLHVEEAVELTKIFCPYEVMALAAKSANFIVCDYYHLFNPRSAASFLFKTGKTFEDAVIIVDEAHNLPERIRETLSSNLSEIGLVRASRELAEFGQYDLSEIVEQIGFGFRKLGKARVGDEREAMLSKEDFTGIVSSCFGDSDTFSKKIKEASDEIRRKKRKSAAGALSSFVEDWLGPDEGYVRTIKVRKTKSGKPFSVITYRCLDPAIGSKEIVGSARSTILMSGTLVPTKMYAELLGLDEGKTVVKSFQSSFPPENRLNVIATGVTTKFSSRGENQYRKLAGTIERVVAETPGSVAVFFPSYILKSEISALIQFPQPVYSEKQEMDKKEKTDFLRQFFSEKRAVLLAVAGGSLSEGVDFPKNVLKGVVVVGLPLQQPTLETKALIDYYQKKFGRGWDYGYLYPGISRAIQAAGRMIRSESDRGVAVFLDERYTWANYRKCFPPELKTVTSAFPEKLVGEFWNNKGKE